MARDYSVGVHVVGRVSDARGFTLGCLDEEQNGVFPHATSGAKTSRGRLCRQAASLECCSLLGQGVFRQRIKRMRVPIVTQDRVVGVSWSIVGLPEEDA